MKKKSIHLIAAFTACIMLFGTMVSAYAATYASDYFWRTSVAAVSTEPGKIIIEFDIVATEYMDKLGAKQIDIWKQQYNGEYIKVLSYYDYNTEGLMEENTDGICGHLTYYGTRGTNYFAGIHLYAENSSGNEGKYYETNIVTVK